MRESPDGLVHRGETPSAPAYRRSRPDGRHVRHDRRVAAAPSVRAAGEVSVVASGGVSAGFGQYDTFSVAARDDGTGSLTGSIRMTRGGQPSDGTVTCLAVDGTGIVVGGATTPFGQFPPPVQYFTLYLTDNGPTGTLDTVAFDGPTPMAPPDCGVPGPLQQPLSYGQVTILDGPSDAARSAATARARSAPSARGRSTSMRSERPTAR